MLASFDDGGAVPQPTVKHQVSLRDYTGRQTILARWNIADTVHAFYVCVDLYISPTPRRRPSLAQLPRNDWNTPCESRLGLNGTANTDPNINVKIELRNGFVTRKG
ncbi:hypothetical protein C8R45DRAFT_1095759 [Mycena sanguinolenta]|nr:hypothetical protein C8R45DRAFT_1095759 [Mycena sanguinolenta]